MTVENIHSTYYDTPTLYWYTTKKVSVGEYQALYKLGRHYVGFLNEPSEDDIYDKELVYVSLSKFDEFDKFIQNGGREQGYEL